MKVLCVLAFSLLVGVSSAWSACKEGKAPVMPNLDVADMAVMLQAQVDVKAYIDQQMQFLACSRDGLKHNRAIDKMHQVAGAFNALARQYKQGESQRQSQSELALVSY